MKNNTKPKNVRQPRKKENRYRVWFKDGTSTVMFAGYPNEVYDQLPPSISMQVAHVVDDLE